MPSTDSYHLKDELNKLTTKLFVVLGPDITTAVLGSIKGISVGNDGYIYQTTGDEKEILREIRVAFEELSPMLGKKIFDPFLKEFGTQNDAPEPVVERMFADETIVQNSTKA